MLFKHREYLGLLMGKKKMSCVLPAWRYQVRVTKNSYKRGSRCSSKTVVKQDSGSDGKCSSSQGPKLLLYCKA